MFFCQKKGTIGDEGNLDHIPAGVEECLQNVPFNVLSSFCGLRLLCGSLLQKIGNGCASVSCKGTAGVFI